MTTYMSHAVFFSRARSWKDPFRFALSGSVGVCLFTSYRRWFVCAVSRFINLLFGRRRMLPMVLTWQRIMSKEFFVTCIDVAMGYLFSWKSNQARRESLVFCNIMQRKEVGETSELKVVACVFRVMSSLGSLIARWIRVSRW